MQKLSDLYGNEVGCCRIVHEPRMSVFGFCIYAGTDSASSLLELPINGKFIEITQQQLELPPRIISRSISIADGESTPRSILGPAAQIAPTGRMEPHLVLTRACKIDTSPSPGPVHRMGLFCAPDLEWPPTGSSHHSHTLTHLSLLLSFITGAKAGHC